MNDFEKFLHNIQSELTAAEKEELEKSLDAGWQNIKRSLTDNEITITEEGSKELEKLYKLSIKAAAAQDDGLETWCREGIRAWLLESSQIRRLKFENTFWKQAFAVGKTLAQVVFAVLLRSMGV